MGPHVLLALVVWSLTTHLFEAKRREGEGEEESRPLGRNWYWRWQGRSDVPGCCIFWRSITCRFA